MSGAMARGRAQISYAFGLSSRTSHALRPPSGTETQSSPRTPGECLLLWT